MKSFIKKILFKILELSVVKANKQRGEQELKNELANIVSDLSDQYSRFKIDMKDRYLVEKIRSQHSFQIGLVIKALEYVNSQNLLNIVDIGDSSGTHILYLQEILKKREIRANTLSVNLDGGAIDRIKSKGLNAIHCRAEDLHTKENINPDIFLSFEMLEHLFNPISFLHSIAVNTTNDCFVITVPYVAKSRVALHHVRNEKLKDKGVTSEDTHVFELSPDDWKLIFKFSGWDIVFEDIYKQYPSTDILSFSKPIWKKFDFEGFYGVILKKDLKYVQRYKDW